MKSYLKFLFIFIMLFFTYTLNSCSNLYSVNKKDVDKIHETINSFEAFEDEISYLTNFGSITAKLIDDNYNVVVLGLTDKSGTYEYRIDEKTLYKDNEKIEENIIISSLDDFALKVVSLYDSTSYCISLNCFLPFIKEVFLNTKEFKHSVVHNKRVYYSCTIKGTKILNDDSIISIIKQVNSGIEIQNEDSIKLSLLFATDFSKIYPEFEMQNNNQSIIIF